MEGFEQVVVFRRYRPIASYPSCPLRIILFPLTTTYFKGFECLVKSRHFLFCNVLRCFITSSWVTQQRTRRNWSSKSGLKHLRVVCVTFIRFLLSLLGLVAPTSWTDRSFELNLLLLLFTQALHKISIKTSINNTENMPQVTLFNNSAVSIDNEASDLWLLAIFVLFLFKKTNVTFLPILVKWQISVKSDVHNTSLLIKYEIAQIFYDWFDNLKDVFQRICEN